MKMAVCPPKTSISPCIEVNRLKMPVTAEFPLNIRSVKVLKFFSQLYLASEDSILRINFPSEISIAQSHTALLGHRDPMREETVIPSTDRRSPQIISAHSQDSAAESTIHHRP
jgi:hypothetical protein